MKEVNKVLKQDTIHPQYNYIVFDKNGLSAFNGKIGVHYETSLMGGTILKWVEDNGPFAIQDGKEFIKTLDSIEGLDDMKIDKEEATMTIVFAKRKGQIKIPIILSGIEDLPQSQIKWQDFSDKSNSIPISDSWSDIYNVLTNEGESLWEDAVGLYFKDSKLQSFDHSVYLSSTKADTIDGIDEFYVPRSVLALGMKDVDFGKVDEDGNIFLVGRDKQFLCTTAARMDVLKELSLLKSESNKYEPCKVEIDLDKSVWKRAKMFSDDSIRLEVKDKQLRLSCKTWSEYIGTIDSKDFSISVKASLISRWTNAGNNHSICIADGVIYLNNKSRPGIEFFGVAGKEEVIPKAESKSDNKKAPVEKAEVSDDEYDTAADNLFSV